MTSPPSSKWISLRNPRTRARIETSWRARVVPIGSAMMGTVIRRASTTDTTGGGGVRAAPTSGEHPGIATDVRAAPRTIHPRPPTRSPFARSCSFLHQGQGRPATPVESDQ